MFIKKAVTGSQRHPAGRSAHDSAMGLLLCSGRLSPQAAHLAAQTQPRAHRIREIFHPQHRADRRQNRGFWGGARGAPREFYWTACWKSITVPGGARHKNKIMGRLLRASDFMEASTAHGQQDV